MTQADRDAAADLLRMAADDWFANVRHLPGALVGTHVLTDHGAMVFAIACEAWYRVAEMVVDVDDVPRWPLVALTAAQLLEEGYSP